ncbi:hypothetical protein V461_18210 [Pantoea ananatis BRT98]|nr:hypothetical protein V461_18210 [Pantoea ananatis BRT98]
MNSDGDIKRSKTAASISVPFHILSDTKILKVHVVTSTIGALYGAVGR